MKEIEIFDPAMCCSTGVCGPSVDKNLLRIATLIDTLKNMGIEVKRHNLSSEPQAFIHNEKVKQLLQEKGADVLPITLVGGEIAVRKELLPAVAEEVEHGLEDKETYQRGCKGAAVGVRDESVEYRRKDKQHQICLHEPQAFA